jgi:hypothetical protein
LFLLSYLLNLTGGEMPSRPGRHHCETVRIDSFLDLLTQWIYSEIRIQIAVNNTDRGGGPKRKVQAEIQLAPPRWRDSKTISKVLSISTSITIAISFLRLCVFDDWTNERDQDALAELRQAIEEEELRQQMEAREREKREREEAAERERRSKLAAEERVLLSLSLSLPSPIYLRV